MSLEAATYLSQLVAANPAAGDNASQGDDHIRLVKSALQNTFPNASRAFRFFATETEVAGDLTTDVDDMHKVIPVNATAAARTVTLGAVTIDGWFTIITKYDSSSNAVTIDPSGATTINGASSITITNQYESVLCWWDNDEAMWRGMRFFPNKPYYSGGQDIPFSDIAPSANAKRVLAATTATDFSEHTIAAVLEFISTSLARGDILMRGASFFDRLGAGDADKVLTANGAGADLTYEYPRMPARGYGEYVANTGLNTDLPADDTIPQVSEGDEILSVGITTQTNTSRVRAFFHGVGAINPGSATFCAALFRNGAANALASTALTHSISGALDGQDKLHPLIIMFEDAPGNAGTYTYTVRVGTGTGGLRMNGTTSARVHGGAMRATLTLEEIFMP